MSSAPAVRSEVRSYVLVHGAWLGAWCWARVLPALRGAGHLAHAVTLTGVGERAHLMSGDIRLRTHVRDVLSLIASEELGEVVLVGHSYGGMVITGVADALLKQGSAVLRHLVYVDAIVPKPGESWSSTQPPEMVAARLKAAKEAGGVAIPPPDAGVFGLKGEDAAWVNRRQTPQPLGVYQDPLAFDAARVAKLPRTFIDCVSPALPPIAESRKRVRAEPGWQVVELATGHEPMVSMPGELAKVLLDVK
jgi:pimeloyl-ACP methyl ester carboxylesterase